MQIQSLVSKFALYMSLIGGIIGKSHGNSSDRFPE